MPKANRKPTHPPMRVKAAYLRQDGKCSIHPRYQAIRQPRCNCVPCWKIWARKQEAIVRPDTDDPRDMMPAEAACEVEDGPLIRTPWQDDDPADDGVEDEVDGTPETP